MAQLQRQLSLPLLVLYGLGTTIGVGIYALLGKIAGVAGVFAPWSFVVAATLAGLTALSFAELANRYPRAAATALFIERGFGNVRFAVAIGALLAGSAIVSTATLANGLVGYMQVFLDVPSPVIIVATLSVIGAIAAWGIKQSAWFAAVTCLLELGGVLWIIALSSTAINVSDIQLSELRPNVDSVGLIFAGAVLSFYAYIGFEDMVEVAEEVRDVRRTLPIGILITLIVTALLYVLLMLSTQYAVGIEFLAGSDAPFADVYQELTQRDPVVLSSIGVLAMLNGMLIQIIMSSRIFYGLAHRGQFPQAFGHISSRRGTPDVATWTVTLAAATLALLGGLTGLATITSVMTLTVFSLVNLALFRIKSRQEDQPSTTDGFRVHRAIPLLGALCCAGFAASAVVSSLNS